MGTQTQAELELFAGEPDSCGGLSNEQELVRLCPMKFKYLGNKWSNYMDFFFSHGTGNAHWDWKSQYESERKQQRICLVAIRGSFKITDNDKRAILGWMLSEMLIEVPSRWCPRSKSRRR